MSCECWKFAAGVKACEPAGAGQGESRLPRANLGQDLECEFI